MPDVPGTTEHRLAVPGVSRYERCALGRAIKGDRVSRVYVMTVGGGYGYGAVANMPSNRIAYSSPKIAASG